MKQGDRVYVCGDSSELWLEDYNVRVSTNAIVEETPSKNAKKVYSKYEHSEYTFYVFFLYDLL